MALNADEFYLPSGLDRLTRIATEQELDVAFGEAIFVNEPGRFLRALPQHGFSHRTLWWYGMFIPTCAILVRATVLRDFSFDEKLRRVMDWDMALHLAEKGCSFGFLSAPIGAFRVHPGQVTAAPASAFPQEYNRLAERYSEHGRRHLRAGRLLHAALKLRYGAYRRQLRSRRCMGLSMRWFAEDEGQAGVAELFGAYGTGQGGANAEVTVDEGGTPTSFVTHNAVLGLVRKSGLVGLGVGVVGLIALLRLGTRVAGPRTVAAAAIVVGSLATIPFEAFVFGSTLWIWLVVSSQMFSRESDSWT